MSEEIAPVKRELVSMEAPQAVRASESQPADITRIQTWPRRTYPGHQLVEMLNRFKKPTARTVVEHVLREGYTETVVEREVRVEGKKESARGLVRALMAAPVAAIVIVVVACIANPVVRLVGSGLQHFAATVPTGRVEVETAPARNGVKRAHISKKEGG